MANDGELVTVYETQLRERIALVEYALRDAGIQYVAANETVSTVYPVDGMAVVRFQVVAADADRARTVIGALPFDRKPPAESEDEPEDDSRDGSAPESPDSWLRVHLRISAAEAAERLAAALQLSDGAVQGTVSAGGFVLRSSASSLFGCTCRGRMVDVPGGSQLACSLGSGLLQNAGVLAVIAATCFYMVQAFAVAVSGSAARIAAGTVLLLPACVWVAGLAAAVWGALRRRRQGERLRDFLSDVLGDAAPGSQSWVPAGG